MAVPLWLAVVFIPVWVGWMRERIEKAAAIVSAAANALLNMPHTPNSSPSSSYSSSSSGSAQSSMAGNGAPAPRSKYP